MRKNTQAGFSLVELMVVVAIIGVLATIAIPRVNRFIAKSRTTEAQSNLSAIYTFNKTFYVEFQGYTNSFQVMGYLPEGQLRYRIGWSQAAASCPTNFTTLKGAGLCAGVTDTVADCAATPARCTVLNGADNAAPPAIGANSSIAANNSAFQAAAVALLVVGGNGNDLWTITDTKNLLNPNDGTL